MSKYKNDFERDVGNKLKKLKAHASYEIEKLPYVLEGKYNPDFTLKDGTIVECKGYFRPADRRKMVSIRKQYPDRRIIICFYRPFDKIKNSKTTYAGWAERTGFEWCTLETLKDAIKN